MTKSVREWIEGDFRTVEVVGAAMAVSGCMWAWLSLQAYVLIYFSGPWVQLYAAALSYHLPIPGMNESLPGLFFIGSVGLGSWALFTCDALSRECRYRGRVLVLVFVSFALTSWTSWTVYRSGDYVFAMAGWELETMRAVPEPSLFLQEEIEFGERNLEAYAKSRGW